MTREEAFNELYSLKGYPEVLKNGMYSLFERVYVNVSRRMYEDHLDAFVLDPEVVLSYIYEEHLFNVSYLNKNQVDDLLINSNYVERMTTIVSDKIFFNEFKGYKNNILLNQYHPLATTFTFFLNFILNRFASLPKNVSSSDAVFLDVLKKGFIMSKGVINLLTEGHETEAFSTWRTIHEVECIAKILFANPSLSSTYIRHIEYASYYRNDNGNPKRQEELFAEIKEKMKERNLKSKDTKKFVEYGWLYDIPNVDVNYPELKLNFRKGVELVADLSAYSSIYEMSSEIAHSSPLLIYSNRDYFKSLSIINLYDTFFRLEDMLYQYLLKQEIDSSSYYAMRKDYLIEMKKNLSIENFTFQMKYQKR